MNVAGADRFDRLSAVQEDRDGAARREGEHRGGREGRLRAEGAVNAGDEAARLDDLRDEPPAFGTLPDRVTEVAPATAIVSIDDDDTGGVAVSATSV